MNNRKIRTLKNCNKITRNLLKEQKIKEKNTEK